MKLAVFTPSSGSALPVAARHLVLMLAFLLPLTAGCETTKGLFKSTSAGDPSMGSGAGQAEAASETPPSPGEMAGQIRALQAQLESERAARDSLERRLDLAQAAREDAIREVVRIRARIQGMASLAEASAMFAEARVILDRMEEEAFSDEALEQLQLARSYLVRGKGALDDGNPGGAAYLFDLISGLYEGMKKSEPYLLKVVVKVASLREGPSPTAARTASVYLGEKVAGLERNKDWVKVKAGSGVTGWLMRNQVQ